MLWRTGRPLGSVHEITSECPTRMNCVSLGGHEEVSECHDILFVGSGSFRVTSSGFVLRHIVEVGVSPFAFLLLIFSRLFLVVSCLLPSHPLCLSSFAPTLNVDWKPDALIPESKGEDLVLWTETVCEVSVVKLQRCCSERHLSELSARVLLPTVNRAQWQQRWRHHHLINELFCFV